MGSLKIVEEPNSGSRNEGAAVFIAIGGVFEVETLRQKQNKFEFENEFNNQLATVTTPEELSKKHLFRKELMALLKSGAAFAIGGSYSMTREGGYQHKTWFDQKERYWDAEISFISSAHFEKEGTEYVNVASIITLTEGTSVYMKTMAEQTVGQQQKIQKITAPVENKNLVTIQRF